MDVSTDRSNVAGNPDDFDATQFIKAVVPYEGYDSNGTPGAKPGVTYTSKDATTFYQLIPGTGVEFTVHFENDVRPGQDKAQIFKAKITVVGNNVATLDSRNVYIVVPPPGRVIVIEAPK